MVTTKKRLRKKKYRHYLHANIIKEIPVFEKPSQGEIANSGGRDWYLYHRERGRCLYCSIKLEKRKWLEGYPDGGRPPDAFTLDHIIPLSKGGKKRSIKNLAACCNLCNGIKGNLDVDEFLQKIRYIQKQAKILSKSD